MQTKPKTITRHDRIQNILKRRAPDRVVYAPNYWQWFIHHRNHGLLPEEIRHVNNQLELIRWLGLDVFSRNIYCDATQCWFGGLAEEVYDGVEVEIRRRTEGRDLVTEKIYRTRRGELTERLRFVFSESTLVQEKFLLDDAARQADAFEEFLRGRRWRFNRPLYEQWQREVGDDGLVNAGELFSPLKLLHLAAGAPNAVFLLEDFPDRCRDWMNLCETAQLDLVRQMLDAGVPAMMAMDNLDAAFHTPRYLERCSASFYEKASRLCREAGSTFFIHACGHQRAILPLIASLGVDGLEGVAFPPLGDVELDEAMRLTGDRLIITGGISAMETERFQSYDEVRRYVENLFARMKPYAHRFIFAASCSTSIRTRWEVLKWFRDAWRELGAI
jgi:hypothetical protein